MNFRLFVPSVAALATVLAAFSPARADKFDDQYDLEKRIEKSDNLIRVARISEDAKGAITIKVTVDAPNLGSGARDFAAIAQSMKNVAKFLYGQRAQYSDLLLVIEANSKDRYGNNKPLPDSTVTWKSEDLNKLNPGASPEILMALAAKVSLDRSVKDRARAFCAVSDLKDKRYCQ